MTGAPRLAAPAEPATGKQPFRSEHMDFSEALLTSEKLPMDLQDDTPAAASQVSSSCLLNAIQMHPLVALYLR